MRFEYKGEEAYRQGVRDGLAHAVHLLRRRGTPDMFILIEALLADAPPRKHHPVRVPPDEVHP